LDLIERAGLSRAGLARRVNEEMTRRGRPTSDNHLSVTRWVRRGAVPGGDTPYALAGILSERIGRPVTVAELGMPEAGGRNLANVGMKWASDTVGAIDAVVELSECGADRRELATAAGAASATSEIVLRWLVAPPDEQVVRGDAGHRVDELEVHAVRETGRHLKAIDDSHGGMAALPLGVEYLRREVVPLLRRAYDDRVGRALFAVAAELALGVGWAAYDAARQGLARRHMVQALRLSHAAGDRLFGGRALAAMSHQALHLGDVSLAVDLARAARVGTAGLATPTAQAMFGAMEACAHAARGDQVLCLRALREAERAFERSEPRNDPGWIDFDAGGLAGHAARAFRDLGQHAQAEHYATESIALCQPAHARTRVQRHAILATAQLQAGKVDEARATGHRAAAEARALRSLRARDDIARLHRLLSDRAHGGAVARSAG